MLQSRYVALPVRTSLKKTHLSIEAWEVFFVYKLERAATCTAKRAKGSDFSLDEPLPLQA